jgi:hypothetical protein
MRLGENVMGIQSFGTMGVDWEQRVDYERLRRQRPARAQTQLAGSEIRALLCSDMPVVAGESYATAHKRSAIRETQSHLHRASADAGGQDATGSTQHLNLG